LRISHGDKTPLPGFDWDLFIANGNFNSISIADLTNEFLKVCRANIIFFQISTDEAWEQTGTVNDNLASVRAIAYNMVSHVRHHINSLRSAYLL
jgi:hypothetical protein